MPRVIMKQSISSLSGLGVGVADAMSADVGSASGMVIASAMQAALTTKQDAAAFLTTLVGIGGTSGSGNLARVGGPTFTGTLAASVIAATSYIQTNEYFAAGTQVICSAGAGARINSTGLKLGTSNYTLPIGWTGGDSNSAIRTGLVEASSGVVEINNGTVGTLRDLSLRNVTASGTVTAAEFKASGSQSFGVYSSGSNRTGLFFDGGGGSVRLLLASGGYFGIGSSTTDANSVDTFQSRKSAGVWRLGTTSTGEDGSLVCSLVTAGLAATPGTFAVVNATTATATLGLRRITDRSNRLAYPDGTNWRFVSDDAIIS